MCCHVEQLSMSPNQVPGTEEQAAVQYCTSTHDGCHVPQGTAVPGSTVDSTLGPFRAAVPIRGQIT